MVERRTWNVLETISSDEVQQCAYQDQNATKKPNHAKKKTRPYMLTGFRPGIERALRLTGLTTGAFHSVVGSNILRSARWIRLCYKER